MEDGNGPLNLFSNKSRYFKLGRVRPMVEGMAPSRLLDATPRVSRVDRLNMPEGMLPVNLLEDTWRNLIFLSWEKDDGISPTKPPKINESFVSDVMFPKNGGICTVENPFRPNPRASSFDMAESSAGMAPESSFWRRLR